MSQKPFEVLFVDGNHENFDLLNEFPVEVRYGGKVHKLKDNIYHLMRGEVYEIEGKTFFAFGGATSVDKYMREEHVSWWHEEVYDKEELFNAISNLIRVGYKLDYVITHTAPKSSLNKLNVHLQGAESCSVAKLLGELSNKIRWKKWYFGHFHTDVDISEVAAFVYECVVKIEE